MLRLADVNAWPSDNLVVQAWRHMSVQTAPSRVRVRLTADATVGIYPIGPLAMWITGEESARHQFVEVRGTHIATIRIDVGDLHHGRPDHPFLVYLRPDATVEGAILDSQDRRVVGAVVSAFEFVPGDGVVDGTRPDTARQRRWIAESMSDASGAFSLSGLGSGSYEFVVVHAVAGRTTETHRVDGLPLTLRLAGTPKVHGRVLVEQLPAAGVQVRVVPDRDDFLRSDDPLRLISPPGITDRDGRFELALPVDEGGEIVVGGNGLAKSRYRFAGTDGESLERDLGDINLPAPLSVVIRLIGPAASCDLMAAGPVGSLGLDLVRSVFDPGIMAYRLRLPEPGFWWVEAECGAESGGVIPPVMQIRQDDTARVIQLTLAPPAPP